MPLSPPFRGAACGPDSRRCGLDGWYLLVAVVFFRPLRQKLFLPLLISLTISFMVRPSGPGVLIFDAGRDQATAIIYEDRSADLWYNKSRFSHPDQAAVVVIPALRANGIFTLRRCVVEGEERAYTEALFQKEFTFLKGPGTGDIPYSGVRACPSPFPTRPSFGSSVLLTVGTEGPFRPRPWPPSSMKDAAGTEFFPSGASGRQFRRSCLPSVSGRTTAPGPPAWKVAPVYFC